MQTWWEFLMENYELTEEQYNDLSRWEKYDIDREWKCYIKGSVIDDLWD